MRALTPSRARRPSTGSARTKPCGRSDACCDPVVALRCSGTAGTSTIRSMLAWTQRRRKTWPRAGRSTGAAVLGPLELRTWRYSESLTRRRVRRSRGLDELRRRHGGRPRGASSWTRFATRSRRSTSRSSSAISPTCTSAKRLARIPRTGDKARLEWQYPFRGTGPIASAICRRFVLDRGTHSSRSSPSKARIVSRNDSGTGAAVCVASSTSTSVWCAVDHEHVVLHAVGGALVGHARPPDARDTDERPRSRSSKRAGSEVVDRARAHDELALARSRVLHAEVTVVLDSREVEVGEVPAVVDDALGVGVREADAIERRVLERRLAIGDAAELETSHGDANGVCVVVSPGDDRGRTSAIYSRRGAMRTRVATLTGAALLALVVCRRRFRSELDARPARAGVGRNWLVRGLHDR